MTFVRPFLFPSFLPFFLQRRMEENKHGGMKEAKEEEGKVGDGRGEGQRGGG
jgi:hypothetical protein